MGPAQLYSSFLVEVEVELVAREATRDDAAVRLTEASRPALRLGALDPNEMPPQELASRPSTIAATNLVSSGHI
jgi:hypothetical protein